MVIIRTLSPDSASGRNRSTCIAPRRIPCGAPAFSLAHDNLHAGQTAAPHRSPSYLHPSRNPAVPSSLGPLVPLTRWPVTDLKLQLFTSNPAAGRSRPLDSLSVGVGLGGAGMSREPADLMAPRILLVDDERQIHASVRLRLGRDYALIACLDPRDALEAIAREPFDLCIVDINMPRMDGFTFIETARKSDPALGYIVLSAFDSDQNLRRAIPLQVSEFIPKPLPGRSDFEQRIPLWIESTRRRRREMSLADRAETIAHDLDEARLEREVEFAASETARDALLQTAGLLTTINAHLVALNTSVGERARSDHSLLPWLRSIEEARKTSHAAVAVTGTFFDSAYANRDSSPALVNVGLQHAVAIASRMTHSDETRKAVDVAAFEREVSLPGLSGIEFLLMMTPVIGAALTRAANDTTVRVDLDSVARVDAVLREPGTSALLWVNRRQAHSGHGAVVISVSTSAPPLTQAEARAWLRGGKSPMAAVPSSRLISGIRKCKGVLGIACAPGSEAFRMLLALPHGSP